MVEDGAKDPAKATLLPPISCAPIRCQSCVPLDHDVNLTLVARTVSLLLRLSHYYSSYYDYFFTNQTIIFTLVLSIFLATFFFSFTFFQAISTISFHGNIEDRLWVYSHVIKMDTLTKRSWLALAHSTLN